MDKEIASGKFCPYCGCESEYRDSSIIYGKSYGMIYICVDCDAYVGVHKGSDVALGRLSNKELREAKRKAHQYFDPLWTKAMKAGRSKFEARAAAYKWLADGLGISVKDCHIGLFDVELCERVVLLCMPYK